MTLCSVALGDVAPQLWRNGGGRTRELLAWPPAADWRLRISVADIDADGPFSAFDGVRRWFAVVDGAGVALGFTDGERICRRGDAPLAFDGAAAPACRLLDGPTRDLNLMTRGGDATMSTVVPGVGWSASFAVHALYSAVAGQWSDGRCSQRVAAGTLLWEQSETTEALGPWRFEPDDRGPFTRAWWLGFTPQPEAHR